MALPSFTALGLAAFTFSRGPEAPETRLYRPRQTVQTSDAGRLFVYTYGREEVQHQLSFSALSRSDWEGLLAFFRAVNWSETAYTYTDTEGVAWRVQLVAGGLQAVRSAVDTYSVAITMLEQPASLEEGGL
jgi:hypothetical protein